MRLLFFLAVISFIMTSCKEDHGNEVKDNNVKTESPDKIEKLSNQKVEVNTPETKLIESQDSIAHEKEMKGDEKQSDRIVESSNNKPKVNKKNIEPQPKTKKKLPNIEFANTEYNFGRITQGEVVNYDFVFKNTGKAALDISNAQASCGCTQPVFPFLSIEPGESNKISVQFRSKGRLGHQNPYIRVFHNAPGSPTIIRLKGEVVTEEFSENDSL